MKKIILMTIMSIVALTASAQFEKGSRWGMTVPLGLSSYSDVPGSDNIFASGYSVIYEYNFTKNFYISTEAGFNFRGSKMDGIDGKLTSINATVPINLGGRIIFSERTAVFAQAGVYGSFMVKPASVKVGQYEIEGNDYDWGLSGRLGIELSRIQIFGGYEYGMYDVWDDSTNNTIIFGLAYMF